MNVYLVRYEHVDAYSTARKAIDSIPNGWLAYVGLDSEKNESIYIEKNDANMSKLIAKLGKEYFITFYEYDGSNEMITVTKEQIQ